jgi:hypothetical protein
LVNDIKSDSLRENINDAARNEKSGLRILSAGVMLVNLGLIMSVLKDNLVAYVLGFFSVVLGIVSIVFGFCVTLYFVRKYNALLEEASISEIK